MSSVSVNHTRGVRKLVSFGNYPAQIPERLIEQLKARVDHNNLSPISSLPEQGDRLQILEGPFRGLNAIFSQIDGDSRGSGVNYYFKSKGKSRVATLQFKL